MHVALRRFFMTTFPPQNDPSSLLSHRVIFDFLFALCFLAGVHGLSTLKILLILTLNYIIAKTLGGTKALTAVTWLFNIGVLFLNEWYDGYTFASVHSFAAPLVGYPLSACAEVRMRSVGSCIVGKSCLISLRYD